MFYIKRRKQMKLTTNNSNYCATVIKIEQTIPLVGCDNVVGVPIFGFQAITSKDIDLSQLYLVFTSETQLSDDYCKSNNLYRKSELNADTSKTGYIEENRRIKAMKFRGHTSSALIMPLASLWKYKRSDLMV
jgi:hypothetical protein